MRIIHINRSAATTRQSYWGIIPFPSTRDHSSHPPHPRSGGAAAVMPYTRPNLIHNFAITGCQLTCSTWSEKKEIWNSVSVLQWIAKSLNRTISGTRSSTLVAPKSLMQVMISRSKMLTILTTPASPYAYQRAPWIRCCGWEEGTTYALCV